MPTQVKKSSGVYKNMVSGYPAPAPPPAFPSPLEVFPVEIAPQTEEGLRSGKLDYVIPGEMEIDEVTKCVIRISGSEVANKQLRIGDSDEFKEIPVGEEMSVKLIDVSGGRDFEINAVSTETQKLVFGEYSEWVFYVRPLSGKKAIHVLTLSIRAHFDGGTKDLPIIEKSINVSKGDYKRVVFAAADVTQDLDLEREASIIKKQLAKGKKQFQYTAILNLDVLKLQQMLKLETPDVLHFSGHGSVEGIMVYGDRKEDGPVLASSKHLQKIFSTILKNRKVPCLILNACYSATQFEVLQKFFSFGIGTSAQIPNSEAQKFSKYFYHNLYTGNDYESAYDLSLAAINIDERDRDKISLYRKYP